MRITPGLEEFRKFAADRRVIPVYSRMIVDDITPVALYESLCGDRTNTFLLESAEAGVWSRYSFVGVRTAATLTEADGRANWVGRELVGISDGDPLQVLKHTLQELATPANPDLPPFHAGMVGYLGYDLVRRLHDMPDNCTDDLALPELVMMLTSELAVFDHHRSEVWLIANAINFDGGPQGVDRAHADAAAAVRAMAKHLRSPRRALTPLAAEPAALDVRRQRSSADYQRIVQSAISRISSGEASQVVVSQRFDVPNEAAALDVYRCLRLTNPSPYLYLLRLDGFDIVGSSPESLVTVSGGVATTRPIAGSRPRGTTEAEDQALAEELLADPKERAEHLMLVELGCEELGQVSREGTVTVHEQLKIHRYSHIMHMEASISGELEEGRTALDATLACFPAGTLTGSPKPKAMEMIDELEESRRGVYGGVVGYFDFAGDSDVAIAIRTAILKGGTAHVQAGAGIVAGSNPASEDAECGHKAAAVISALGRAAATTKEHSQ